MKHKTFASKKAQITVFIIVGVMLVFSSGIYLYIQNQTVEIKLPDVIMEEVPAEFNPIASYVTNCIKSTAEKALVKIGEGGGYIDFRATSSFDPTNGNANGVKFPGTTFPGSKDIPYWYYLVGENSGKLFTPATEQPYLTKEDRDNAGRTGTSIEEELETFFDAEFPKCIDDFEAFKGQGYFIAQGAEPKSYVVIAEDDVVFKLLYPLTLKKGAHETKSSKYRVTIPLKLRKIYYLAADIAAAQNHFTFLEKDAIATLSAYGGIKEDDPLPPFTGFDIGGGARSWSKADVARKFYRIIQLNSQALQIEDSKNFRPNLFYPQDELLNQLKQGIYGNKILPGQALLDSEEFVEDFEVSFNVPEAKQYFDINCGGAICKASTVDAGPFGVKFHNYNFVYDISYPVVVQIYDPEYESPVTAGQKGFEFRFASEVNVRGNEPLTAEMEFEEMEMPEATMFCDEDKRTSGNIEFDIKDSITREHLAGVLIQIEMPDSVCDVNTTDTDEGPFVTKLPSGFCGGKIRLSKEGYLGKEINDICLNYGEGRKFEELLKPMITVKAKVRYKTVKNIAPFQWEFQSSGDRRMNKKESALIMLTRIPEEGDALYSVPIMIEAGSTSFSRDPYENVTLVEGKYTIDAQVFSGEPFVIMRDRRKECYRILGVKQCKDYYVPEKNERISEFFPVGGLAITEDKPWEIKPYQLSEGNYVTFKMVYIDYIGAEEINLKIEDLEQIGMIEDYTKDHRNSLKPRISQSII